MLLSESSPLPAAVRAAVPRSCSACSLCRFQRIPADVLHFLNLLRKKGCRGVAFTVLTVRDKEWLMISCPPSSPFSRLCRGWWLLPWHQVGDHPPHPPIVAGDASYHCESAAKFRMMLSSWEATQPWVKRVKRMGLKGQHKTVQRWPRGG